MIDASRLERISEAVGRVRRVAYEAAHVYPLSAPAFLPDPGVERPRDVGPLKVYLHVPFCNYACSFCFYVKRVGASGAEMERYVEAVARELAEVAAGTPLAQLYVGGGTPTALPAELLDRALAGILGHMPRRAGASATVECSPESISDAHIAVLRGRGVERASMGIESLEDEVLGTVRRDHGAAVALDACERLVGAGLYLNVDFIYGLPGQTHASFARDVELAVARGVHSISVYSLRLNERTPVARAMAEVERMDLARLMGWRAHVECTLKSFGFVQKRWHTFVREQLAASGFDRAPCAEGFEPGAQIGLGVSAVSHLGNEIYRNDLRPGGYLARVEAGGSPVAERFSLQTADRKTLLVARTLGDGQVLDRTHYEQTVGRSLDADFEKTLARLRDAGLLEDDGRCIALSQTGRLVYDLVTLAFYPDSAQAWLDERQRSRSTRSSAPVSLPPPGRPA